MGLTSLGRKRFRRVAAVAVLLCVSAAAAAAQASEALILRGHPQTLRLYGAPAGQPVIVSSGDGGWIHLGPQVAEFLAARGFFVVGFDVRSYLAGFTSGKTTLKLEDEPSDYQALAAFASKRTGMKPILIGVSEGAGLSLLAADDPAIQRAIAGVIALGVPDLNELGWRWKDSLIYVTHRAPDEPTFTSASVAGKVSPLPLAIIHSTHDEFTPLAQAQQVLAHASDPKKLWVVEASDHRFSDNLATFNQRLLDAIEWVKQNTPR